jgi:hypothetical protein
MTTMPYMLTQHRDIQNWVSSRRGMPAISRIRNRLGEERAQLRLRFDRAEEGKLDTQMSPCSWNAWLAELDRQQLALKVDDGGDFSLVPRATMN